MMPAKLTAREAEFYRQMVDECRSIKESADVMCISIETGKQHWKNIKLKLHLNKITELSKYYFTTYLRNVGAIILLILFSLNAHFNSDDMRVRRTRRGRRNEIEFYYECDY